MTDTDNHPILHYFAGNYDATMLLVLVFGIVMMLAIARAHRMLPLRYPPAKIRRFYWFMFGACIVLAIEFVALVIKMRPAPDTSLTFVLYSGVLWNIVAAVFACVAALRVKI